MNTQERKTPNPRGQPHHGWEIVLFLLASTVGVYGIGRGLAGFYEQGQQISLVWLAATGVAIFVLFAQMGRVHDTWPHRPKREQAASIHAIAPVSASADATRETRERTEP